MIPVLLRVTTEFIGTEDRVRLSGEIEDRRVLIWLTRRLLGLLLPLLLERLEEQIPPAMPEHRETLQEFAQQAAWAALEPSAPVVVGREDTIILATAADVARAEHGVMLTIRDEIGGAFNLPLSSQALRQWLHILYRADRQADWNLPQWPAWLTGENELALEPTVALH